MLRKIGATTKFAQRGHPVPWTPCHARAERQSDLRHIRPVIMMHAAHGFHGANERRFGIAPEFDDREMREFWRQLARLITFFDLCSPRNFSAGKIARFFRKSAPGRTRTSDPRLRRAGDCELSARFRRCLRRLPRASATRFSLGLRPLLLDVLACSCPCFVENVDRSHQFARSNHRVSFCSSRARVTDQLLHVG